MKDNDSKLLEEAYNKIYEADTKKKCNKCKGTGIGPSDEHDNDDCKYCYGTGIDEDEDIVDEDVGLLSKEELSQAIRKRRR